MASTSRSANYWALTFLHFLIANPGCGVQKARIPSVQQDPKVASTLNLEFPLKLPTSVAETPTYRTYVERMFESQLRYAPWFLEKRNTLSLNFMHGDFTPHQWHDYVIQNRALGDSALNVYVYFILADANRIALEDLRYAYGQVEPDLLKVKMYTEVLRKNPKPIEAFACSSRDYIDFINSPSAEFICGDMTSARKSNLVHRAVVAFEALLGLGREKEALELASSIIAFDQNVHFSDRMRLAAVQAGTLGIDAEITNLVNAKTGQQDP